MITKESLLDAKRTVNEALLRLKQQYNNSPDSKSIYFIVEGKDDIPYYATKATIFIDNKWNVVCINAKNRKNVIDTYNKIDWATYSKERIAFFVDRDLSDYTGEETPSGYNIYVTDSYSIENDLCVIDTYVRTMKYYYELEDIDENEVAILSALYQDCWIEFEAFTIPIMAKILLWKMGKIKSNYSNFKIQSLFVIDDKTLKLKEEFDSVDLIISHFCSQCNVSYVNEDLSLYIDELRKLHIPYEFIRGKYILAFFVSLIKYTACNIEAILPSRKKAKDSLSLGYEDCVKKLCGIMGIPSSLKDFFDGFNLRLIQIERRI